jgi:outer membrane protein
MTPKHNAFPLFARRSTVVAGLLALQLTAQAQVLAPEIEAKEDAASGSHWGLGIGAGYSHKAYRDFDDSVSALPLVLYENRYISFFGTTLDAKLPSVGPISFRLRARYAGDGYKPDDSPYLSGMAERKGGLWVGGAAIWRGDFLNASAEALAASGNSDGKRFKMELNHNFKSGGFTITPRVSASWYDSKYVDYYYGVLATEARADRAQYLGKSTTNTELGLRVGYAISAHHNVFVDVSATALGKAIKDSPLVESSGEQGVKFGYFYNF